MHDNHVFDTLLADYRRLLSEHGALQATYQSICAFAHVLDTDPSVAWAIIRMRRENAELKAQVGKLRYELAAEQALSDHVASQYAEQAVRTCPVTTARDAADAIVVSLTSKGKCAVDAKRLRHEIEQTIQARDDANARLVARINQLEQEHR